MKFVCYILIIGISMVSMGYLGYFLYDSLEWYDVIAEKGYDDGVYYFIFDDGSREEVEYDVYIQYDVGDKFNAAFGYIFLGGVIGVFLGVSICMYIYTEYG